MRGLKKKYYLTGIDWFAHLFDYMAKQATGVGNLFQIVVELDGTVSEKDLSNALDRIYTHFPLLTGDTRRSLNLAPYYRPEKKAHNATEQITVYGAADEAGALNQIESLANRPFASDSDHLECHLVNTPGSSRLVMRCDHRLFDARGAEAFLHQFDLAWRDDALAHINPVMPAHLNQWQKKFQAGQSTNRMFLKLSENGTPRALPPEAASRNYKFLVIPFTQPETEQILETAYKSAGFLMLMPYLLAVSATILHPRFVERGKNPGSYVIPVTVDRRDAEAVQQDLFFNHLSFLFFQLDPTDTAASLPDTLATIKSQLYDQVKNKFSDAIYESGFLMRILPPALLSRIMLHYLKGNLASFSFSHLGETAYPTETFMGLPIKNIVHTPRLPVPPGIGVFFSQFQGRLNLTVSYLEGMLSDADVETIRHRFKQELTAS